MGKKKNSSSENSATNTDAAGSVSCTVCSEKFKSNKMLKVHKRSCVTEHYCATCKRGFKTSQQLKHHNHKLFPCEECGKEFSNKKKLNNHITSHIKRSPLADVSLSENADEEPEETSDKENEVGMEEEEEEVEESEISLNSCEQQSNKKFNWEAVIKKLLLRSEGREVKLKKLRKAVLTAYINSAPSKPYTQEELNVKFNYKVTHNRKFKVHKETVKLVT